MHVYRVVIWSFIPYIVFSIKKVNKLTKDKSKNLNFGSLHTKCFSNWCSHLGEIYRTRRKGQNFAIQIIFFTNNANFESTVL